MVVLLAGSTGSGKTHLALSAGSVMTGGDESAVLRLDLTLFANEISATNIFGVAKGYVGAENHGLIAEHMLKNPELCVIILDEVEKSHPTIRQSFIALFDTGRLRSNNNQVISCRRLIILLTSNSCAQRLVAAGKDADVKSILLEGGEFSPEFLARCSLIYSLVDMDTKTLASICLKEMTDFCSVRKFDLRFDPSSVKGIEMVIDEHEFKDVRSIVGLFKKTLQRSISEARKQKHNKLTISFEESDLAISSLKEVA
jgi:ATP-dependent Clp protease ATP-binding subunit ClpA